MTLLQREGSIHAIDRKYIDDTSNFDKEKIEGDALSVIQLSLASNVLCKTAGIKKDGEMLTCALLFSLNSKYLANENSMMYSKKPKQVQQALNSSDMQRQFEGDKDDEAMGSL
ncbi:hypothetical protein KY290_000580 [Solanum tuberosum]|uniref:Uncharacterized protein n=1 Tax=Solanum tuberosum TaxID=4113 RepID=A0ABQ7WJR2_SOLTU|nr:hypothetical protein KY290_000580 [Solanum tuberosum]